MSHAHTRHSLKRVLGGSIAALLVAASLTVIAASTQPQIAVAAPANPTISCSTDSSIFNTGNATPSSVLADNTPDNNWQVSGPVGTVPPNNAQPTWATVEAATGAPIQMPSGSATWTSPLTGIPTSAVGAWTTSPYTNAQWVTQNGKAVNQTTPGASWYYRYTFSFDPAINPVNYSLVLNFFADNSVAEVFVNGHPQSPYDSSLRDTTTNNDPLYYSGFAAGHGSSVTLNHDWNGGTGNTNTIVVQTYSAPPNEGFDVQAQASTPCVSAVNDTDTVAAGTTGAPKNVLANDTSASGSPLSVVTIVSQPTSAEGSATANSNGTVTFTAGAHFSGVTHYTYQACDTSSPANCAQAVVTVTVPNTVTAVNDTDSTSVGTPKTTNVFTNDTLADPNKTYTATIPNGQGPSHGSVSIGANGALTYTPTGTYSGPDSYTYQVCDNSTTPVCSTAVVHITVTNSIVAVDDTVTVATGSSVATNVTSNDTIADRSNLTVSIAAIPQHGSTSISGNTVTYTPTPGYSGPDSYDYTVCDNSTPQVCDTATAHITVTNGIVASPSGVATPQNSPIALPVTDLVSTTGAALDPSSVSMISQPSHGHVTVSPAGLLTYTPNAGYTGTDSYQVNVCDLSTPAQCVTLTVPVNVGPNIVDAAPDSLTVTPGQINTLSVLANDSSSTGQPLNPNSLRVTRAPAHGVVTVSNGVAVYAPNAGYTGPDSFRYVVCDTTTPTPVCGYTLVTLALPVPADPVKKLAFTGSEGVGTTGLIGVLMFLIGFILVLWRRRSALLAK